MTGLRNKLQKEIFKRLFFLVEIRPVACISVSTICFTNNNARTRVYLRTIQATLGLAIQVAIAPYTAKLNALERASMPPPVACPMQRQLPANPPRPAPAFAAQQVRQGNTGAEVPLPHPDPHTTNTEGDFTQVPRRGRKGKGKAGAGGQAPQQINLTPVSYASAAANAAYTQQPKPLQKVGNGLPSITEVTVIQSGGHFDPHTETQIRACLADAIVREVRINMGKKVLKPIPLRAGRWSIHCSAERVLSL